jgi:hypothetical protein
MGQVFSLELSEREQNGSEAKNALKPYLRTLHRVEKESGSEECSAKGSISDHVGCGGGWGRGGGAVSHAYWLIGLGGGGGAAAKASECVLQEVS